jgi:hypothetical protein
MKLARKVAFAACITLASVTAIGFVPDQANAQTTTAVEYYSGLTLTAKADHTLPGRHKITKGTKAQVTKVYTSSTSGNTTHLDLLIGDLKIEKLAVQKVRDSYSK